MAMGAEEELQHCQGKGSIMMCISEQTRKYMRNGKQAVLHLIELMHVGGAVIHGSQKEYKFKANVDYKVRLGFVCLF